MASPVALLLLSATLYATGGAPAPAPPQAGIELRYDRPLGQVADYRLILEVSGEQISLGEKVPVKWKARVALREEVVARGKDGALWVRTRGRLVESSDGNGTFGAGLPARWPEVQAHISPTGEVLETSVATGEAQPGARERAFVALFGEAQPILLPAGRVQVGDEWQVEAGAAVQMNRLAALSGSGSERVARITSKGVSPLALEEAVPELGLSAQMAGEARQTSEMELAMDAGVPRRHKGRVEILTNSHVVLSLPDRPEGFDLSSSLTVVFDLQLVAVGVLGARPQPSLREPDPLGEAREGPATGSLLARVVSSLPRHGYRTGSHVDDRT